jgi:hypothetical protein
LIAAQVLIPSSVMAANAVVFVEVAAAVSPGVLRVGYTVALDDGVIGFGSQVNLNFTASMNQFLTDLKNRVAAQILARGGPVLAASDIWVFGGPQ